MLLDNQNLNARDPGRRSIGTNRGLAITIEENERFLNNMAKDVIRAIEVQDKAESSFIMQYYVNAVSNISNYKEMNSQISSIVFGSQINSDKPMAVPAFSDLFSESEDSKDQEDSLHPDWKSDQSVSTAADPSDPSALSLQEVDYNEDLHTLLHCGLCELGICQRGTCLEDGTLRVGYTTANPQLQGEISENTNSDDDSSAILASSRLIKRRGIFRRGRGAGRGRRF